MTKLCLFQELNVYYNFSQKLISQSNLENKILYNILKRKRPFTIQSLDVIDENGFSEDDLVIGISSKEREPKIDARMFALNTI